ATAGAAASRARARGAGPRRAGVPSARSTTLPAKLEHALERAGGADADVLRHVDLGREIAERIARRLERDHLHVVAELAALVEALPRHLEEQAIREPAFGDDQELAVRALLR